MMDEIKRQLQKPLFKNSLILLISNGVSTFLGFIFWLAAARYYLPGQIGLAGAVIPALGLISLLSMVGFNVSIVRYLPGEKDKAGMINSSFTVTGIISVVIALIFIAGLPLWSPGLLFIRQDIFFLLYFVIFCVANSIFLLHKPIFIALRSARLSFIQDTLWNILKITLVVVLVSFGVKGIVSTWGIATVLGLVAGNLLLIKNQPGYRPAFAFRKKILNEMTHFSIMSYGAEIAAVAGNYLMPMVVLGVLGAELNAYFYIALRVASLLFVIPYVVSFVLLAEGSRDPENIRPAIVRAARLIFALLLPSVIIVLLLGDKVLLFFGVKYAENAVWVLRVLAISSIPAAVNELYVATRRIELKAAPTIWVYSGIAILTLGVSYILMRDHGLLGAGIGWLAGQSAVAAVCAALIIRRNLRPGKI